MHFKDLEFEFFGFGNPIWHQNCPILNFCVKYDLRTPDNNLGNSRMHLMCLRQHFRDKNNEFIFINKFCMQNWPQKCLSY